MPPTLILLPSCLVTFCSCPFVLSVTFPFLPSHVSLPHPSIAPLPFTYLRHHPSPGFSPSLWMCQFRVCLLFLCLRQQHQVLLPLLLCLPLHLLLCLPSLFTFYLVLVFLRQVFHFCFLLFSRREIIWLTIPHFHLSRRSFE